MESFERCVQASTPEGREVAIKALSLRRMADWKKLELFQREAKILESLSQPGIPRQVLFSLILRDLIC